MSATDRRLDELRIRRATRAAERAALEERRVYGLSARHTAKLAWLAARAEAARAEEEKPTEPDNSIPPPGPGQEPEVA